MSYESDSPYASDGTDSLPEIIDTIFGSQEVTYNPDALDSDIILTLKERTGRPPCPFPPLKNNWYRAGKYSLDIDPENTVDGTILEDIAIQNSEAPDGAGVTFNSNLVLDWPVMERADGVKAAGTAITTVCAVGKKSCCMELPRSAEFDNIVLDLRSWNEPLTVKATESFSFSIRNRTFCLTFSERFGVFMIFTPQTQESESLSRDEKSSGATNSALLLSDATQFATYLSAIDEYAWTSDGHLTLTRDRWVRFGRCLMDNYDQSTHLQSDFFSRHRPALLLVTYNASASILDYPPHPTRAPTMLDVVHNYFAFENVHNIVVTVVADLAVSQKRKRGQHDDGSARNTLLLGRQWIGEQWSDQQKTTSFVPVAFNPSLGGFSATSPPKIFRERFEQVINESTGVNGRMRYIWFGSCEGQSTFMKLSADDRELRASLCSKIVACPDLVPLSHRRDEAIDELLNGGQNLYDTLISALEDMKTPRFRVEQQVLFGVARIRRTNQRHENLAHTLGDIVLAMTQDLSSWNLRAVDIEASRSL
ncbi:hypothetical protein V1506DRAFT_574813 [Lipomyces tetrasporus]